MTIFDHAWLCQQIVEETPDAIIVADRDGIIRLWNKGAEATFGYGQDEAVGQTLDLIIPERLRERHWDGYHTVAETGVTRYGRELLSVPGMRKDGSRLSLEFSIAMLRDGAGQVLGFAAVLRDVTKSWEETRALKERVATLEAQVKNSGTPPADR